MTGIVNDTEEVLAETEKPEITLDQLNNKINFIFDTTKDLGVFSHVNEDGDPVFAVTQTAYKGSIGSLRGYSRMYGNISIDHENEIQNSITSFEKKFVVREF